MDVLPVLSNRIDLPVQSIIDQNPVPQDGEHLSVMEALTRASKRGDRDATELLVFGDLEELSEKSPAAPE